ncbi:MAG: major capsid protein [Microviridae sp.]|nr:MAG: major capsid protein [Microviridae sp.]
MSKSVTIGGERLGSGKKMKASLHGYERSNHDLSYTWRSSMASGTLVPFMTELALPGDTFDIDLSADVMTHPTIGPLFGTYKVQLDVFQVPMRLYLAQLHMNMLNIGRDMSKVILPQIYMEADVIDPVAPVSNSQMNASSIFAYLGIRGVGQSEETPAQNVARCFNAIPYLAYWDIYKSYYANKQEGIGVLIHRDVAQPVYTLSSITVKNTSGGDLVIATDPVPETYQSGKLNSNSTCYITSTDMLQDFNPGEILFNVTINTFSGPLNVQARGTEIWTNWKINPTQHTALGGTVNPYYMNSIVSWGNYTYTAYDMPPGEESQPVLKTFPLANIDQMRLNILRYTPATEADPFIIYHTTDLPPYNLPLLFDNDTPRHFSRLYPQEGLAIKTYNSDQFNNWISTDWIDGSDGISTITAIDTSGGSFTIDELQLNKKIYDMLNRIAVSGGTYDDWLEAVYDHTRTRNAENPMYIGGLIKNLVFQEVISQSAVIGQPLGTLAGRGRIGSKHKGGKIIAKIDEPSYLIGIVSITPNVNYSQGNAWHTTLETMNDLHKPALDQIGFQDLITDQLAWWETKISMVNPLNKKGTVAPNAVEPNLPKVIYRSAGKQPAWLNYMTNVDRTYGNFADPMQQMWMTLNRRYSSKYDTATTTFTIQDLTTYIDPMKFNHIFADTRRDAQNFWVQINVSNNARRKMSAKIMPNL